MMNAEVFQLIGSYGFPIVACIAMAWYVKYTTDKQREEIDELIKRNTEEKAELTKTIDNNTLALQRLCDKLGGEIKL